MVPFVCPTADSAQCYEVVEPHTCESVRVDERMISLSGILVLADIL